MLVVFCTAAFVVLILLIGAGRQAALVASQVMQMADETLRPKQWRSWVDMTVIVFAVISAFAAAMIMLLLYGKMV